MSAEKPKKHGIDGAVYSLAQDGEYHPRLFCLCGFATSQGADTWEDAGADLDEHLGEEAPIS